MARKGLSWSRDSTYRHGFNIAFVVPHSQYADWEDCLRCEKQQVIDALQKRIREVFTEQEYMEAIEGFDSYEEGSLTSMTPEVIKEMEAIDNEDLKLNPKIPPLMPELEMMERIAGVHKSQLDNNKEER
jgi:hypothetical protein